MFHPLRPAAALVLFTALFFTACATTRRQPAGPRDLPTVLTPSATTATYTRCYQTEPDTYLLQTGRRVFKPASGRGPTIELLGAAHIGEPAYYAAIQQRMDRADAVLFEQVIDERKPPNQLTPEESAKRRAGSAYHRLAGLVGLSSQQELVRYDRKHFERCDMTLQQMRALLETEVAKGGKEAAEANAALREFDSLMKALRGDSWLVNFAFWAADKSEHLKASLKFSLVVKTPGAKEGLGLPSRLTQLINEDRSAHVLRDLPKFLTTRPAAKHLVIFYGAAHLPALAQGLLERGYVPAGPVAWLTVARSHPQAEGLEPDDIEDAIDEARHER